jgi:uroporphyrin-3 C-methyltransferase
VSDKQDENTEKLAVEAAASGDAPVVKPVEEDVPAATTAATSAVTAANARPARGGSSAPGWIALLLVLAVAGGLAWSVREQQRNDAGVASRLQAIETAAGREVTDNDLDELNKRWQGQLSTALETMQASTGELDKQSAQLAQTLKALQGQQAEQQAELNRYSANDRDSWLLAEAQYLLRLANQRLIMAGDVVAAQALLGSADTILLELDDVRLHEVRAAVASDLAAVRAVPRVDVEGVYLRLAALVEQAGKLVIFQLPEQEVGPQQLPADNWQGRLRQGYQAALDKLSNYIIIRRRDVPMQALMDPQWEGLVRQNLRMLLEQAQVSLLSGNEILYRESLERAQHWVGEFFESDEAAARAMSREITALTDVDVATHLPDISRSVQALDAVMKQRVQQGGAE